MPCPSPVIHGVRVLPVLWEAPGTTLGNCHYQGCSWVEIVPAPGLPGAARDVAGGWMNGASRLKMKKRSSVADEAGWLEIQVSCFMLRFLLLNLTIPTALFYQLIWLPFPKAKKRVKDLGNAF